MSTSMKKIEVHPMKSIHIETRVSLLEQSIENINQTLIRLENKIDNGFEKQDKRMDKIEQKIDKVESRIWQLFFSGIGALVIVLGIIAHGFKWY